MNYFRFAHVSFACILFAFTSVQAQRCLTDEYYKLHPNELKEREAMINTSMMKNGTRAGDVKIIPVVVHIMHEGGSENLPLSSIDNSLKILNDDFNARNGDLSKIISSFSGITGDTKVEFRRAKIDPDGNCTDGITRTYYEHVGDEYEIGGGAQNLVYWDRSNYLNIWVVKTFGGGINGYANGAGVTLYAGAFVALRTLTHEVGHFFGLSHTWGNGEVGEASNCNTDDGVSDTPNTVGGFACNNLGKETCGDLDNVQNFMDYSSGCRYMFTEGQSSRMNGVLENTGSFVYNLWQDANLVATGTDDAHVEVPCAPKADFGFNATTGCEGIKIVYTDGSYNGVVDGTWSWSWSFPGGTPATSTDQNPVVTYNQAGKHDVTLTTTNGIGSDQVTKTKVVDIVGPLKGEIAPYSQNFDEAIFPQHASDPLKDWKILDSGTPKWEHSTLASLSGDYSMRLRLLGSSAGDVHEIITPPIDMRSLAEPELKFKVAYAKRSSTSSDKLSVFVSTNCGKSWIQRWTRSGTSLATNGGANATSFIPKTDQWVEQTVALLPYKDRESLMFKFQVTAGNGAGLYLEDINIGGPIGIKVFDKEEIKARIFPNPVNNTSIVSIELQGSSDVSIDIHDISGKLISNRSFGTLASGHHSLPLFSENISLQQGIYFVKYTVKDKIFEDRFVKVN